MPGYRRGFSRRRGAMSFNVVNSMKNVTNFATGITSTKVATPLAKAVTNPSPTVSTDVSHGCVIKAIWLSLDFCGLAASGVLNTIHAYLIKSPGDNLTLPGVQSVGTSNEKKFVIKQWQFMGMRNQEGNPPYHWEGWIKLPRRYHRMGTDDIWYLVIATSAAGSGHASFEAIYKWYR